MKRAFLLYFVLFLVTLSGLKPGLPVFFLTPILTDADSVSVKYIQRQLCRTHSFIPTAQPSFNTPPKEENSPSYLDSLLSTVSVYAYTGEHASEGSGIVYSLTDSPKGAYIVTNYHVIFSKENSSLHDKIKISPYALDKRDTMGISAYTVGVSSTYDIALLWIDLSSYPRLPISAVFFREHDLSQGEEIYSVSNAMGKGLAVSEGVISIPSEYIYPVAADSNEINNMRVCRISSPISKGSSGGGVFSKDGYFIALINAKRNDSDAPCVGYAIPFDSVKAVCDTLIKRGSLYCFIPTVELSSVGKEFVYTEDLFSVREMISVKSSAQNKGSLSLLQGDLLISVSIKGKEYPIRHINSLREALFYAEPDDDLIISVKRGGVEISLKKKTVADYFGYIP